MAMRCLRASVNASGALALILRQPPALLGLLPPRGRVGVRLLVVALLELRVALTGRVALGRPGRPRWRRHRALIAVLVLVRVEHRLLLLVSVDALRCGKN